MGISLFKIKKWTNMLLGKSVYHVDQGVGLCYDAREVKGYYNNLTEKVTRFGAEGTQIPKTKVDTGEEIYFSIAVFQYGLGAHDLYLMNADNSMLERAIACADWAVENQQSDGSWITFAYKNPQQPYSAMAQGEGISLLIRAHIATGSERYLASAKKALEFMLKPVDQGGTTVYEGEDVLFLEATYVPLILNGWIFSLWGVYDYCKYTDDPNARQVLDKTLASLKKKLPRFDIRYWSNYQEGGKRICSPFYHRLHIAQLQAMYDLFGDEIYSQYAKKWEKYQNSFWKPKRAFLKKAMQKIFE